MLRSPSTKLSERLRVALVLLHVVGVGRDQVHRLLDLEDRFGARLARLEADHGGELEMTLVDARRHAPQEVAAVAERGWRARTGPPSEPRGHRLGD